MTPLEFIMFFDKEFHYSILEFLKNFEGDVKKPHEWANTLVSWLELSTEEDARRYYEEHYD